MTGAVINETAAASAAAAASDAAWEVEQKL
jgi:hypothetical protein